ncbi:TPA: DUF2239 family protein [Pseudomonas aeruginosa]|uniref:DUF2239 family protein n=1 Tax=Pseudomonas aeruginosa TaxID=287 RepID=UPI00053E35EA|nr:DUF2239 family protein [Pseudomonas aeruginosa]HCL2747311.1 DUF2239 family protein [Pseudomonas aeruginosa 449A]EKU1372229.1 DUF2239 family protein [Pseudomonas aeruginosa]KSH03681.1 hypothetical protein AO968_07405 [Pseudomonas aeruginosa]MCG6990926.1 DUF2239 family protein [Pseudomonas aeruginosa]MCG6997170.1 DUF2239 family protein [Pseudomonas aeruginosa]
MANDPYIQSFTCFDGTRRLLTAALPEVALALKQAVAGGAAGPLLVFDNATGRSVDLDIRGSSEDLLARLVVAGERQPAEEAAPRGRGRPKLGVVAREVTLLPRHWEWLAAQPGGASVALRKLVEEARRSQSGRARQAQERAYHFMNAMAGDLPGFEEATRALFAGDPEGFAERIAGWPTDVREHAAWLASDGES